MKRGMRRDGMRREKSAQGRGCVRKGAVKGLCKRGVPKKRWAEGYTAPTFTIYILIIYRGNQKVNE